MGFPQELPHRQVPADRTELMPQPDVEATRGPPQPQPQLNPNPAPEDPAPSGVLRLPEADPNLIRRHVADALDGQATAPVAAEIAEALAADTAQHYYRQPVEVRVQHLCGRLRITVTVRQPALPSGDSVCHLATVHRLAVCYGMGSSELSADIWAEIDEEAYDDHANAPDPKKEESGAAHRQGREELRG